MTAAEGALRAATGLRYDPTLEARLGFGLTQHEVSLSQPFSFSGEGRAAAQAKRRTRSMRGSKAASGRTSHTEIPSSSGRSATMRRSSAKIGRGGRRIGGGGRGGYGSR